jgi:hypothetical protein
MSHAASFWYFKSPLLGTSTNGRSNVVGNEILDLNGVDGRNPRYDCGRLLDDGTIGMSKKLGQQRVGTVSRQNGIGSAFDDLADCLQEKLAR